MIRSTYTYAVLEISAAAFAEIHGKLAAAGYQHAFDESDGRALIDMHGIALMAEEPAPAPTVTHPVRARRPVGRTPDF